MIGLVQRFQETNRNPGSAPVVAWFRPENIKELLLVSWLLKLARRIC